MCTYAPVVVQIRPDGRRSPKRGVRTPRDSPVVPHQPISAFAGLAAAANHGAGVLDLRSVPLRGAYLLQRAHSAPAGVMCGGSDDLRAIRRLDTANEDRMYVSLHNLNP